MFWHVSYFVWRFNYCISVENLCIIDILILEQSTFHQNRKQFWSMFKFPLLFDYSLDLISIFIISKQEKVPAFSHWTFCNCIQICCALLTHSHLRYVNELCEPWQPRGKLLETISCWVLWYFSIYIREESCLLNYSFSLLQLVKHPWSLGSCMTALTTRIR